MSKDKPAAVVQPEPQCTQLDRVDAKAGNPPTSEVIMIHPFGRIGFTLILIQALYAIFVPIKNVVVIPFPRVVDSSVSTVAYPYLGMNSPNDTLPIFTGSEIDHLMRRILEIAVGNPVYYQKLRAAGGLYLDELLDFVNADEFAVIVQYASIVHQKAEFPSGRFLVHEERGIFMNRTSGSNITRTFRCREQEKYLPGTKCTNSLGETCAGWSLEDYAALVRVDMQASPFPTNGNGWENSIAMSAFIGTFHDALRGVFASQDWSQTLAAMNATLSQSFEFASDGSPYFPFYSESNLATSPFSRNVVINSCGATEMLYINTFVFGYSLALIDSFIRPRNLFGAADSRFTSHPVVVSKMELLFADKYTITSGVKLHSNVTLETKLFGYTLTQKIESKASMKPFRPLDGALLMGDSAQMLKRTVQVSYSGLVNTTYGEKEDTSITSIAGALHSGLMLFKYDWVSQSAAVFKLRERTTAEGTGLPYNLFDRYEAYEDWYIEFDKNSPLSISKFAVPYIGNNSADFTCHQAFVGSMARSIFVGVLDKYRFSTFLQYQWKLPSSNYLTWYITQLNHVLQMVGENSAGARTGVPYQLDTAFTSRYGAAWPIFPILAIMRRNYTTIEIFDEIIPVINYSWPLTQASYLGRAVLFDAYNCEVGLTTSDGTTPGSNIFYNELYPAVAAVVKRMIDVAPQIHELMNANVAPIVLNPDSITGTVTYPGYEWIDKSPGAPYAWEHNALQLGLTKFIGFQLPTRPVFRQMEKLLVCFDTVETRYLNHSVRCYTEYGAQTIVRVEKVSTLLKTFLTTNWAHGVVLNVLGAYASIRFLVNLVRVYRRTQFRDVNLAIAMSMFILGPDTISVSELSILAASNIPLLVGYHLPANPGFVDESDRTGYLVAEAIIALSLSWFVRLGTELGRRCIHLKYSNIWYEAAMSRAQYAILVIVFGVRACIPQVNGEYNRGIAVLIFSLALSTLLGFLLVVSTKLIDTRPPVMTIMDTILLEHSIPRNRVGGPLAQSSSGWHISGMVFEKWYVGGDRLWFGPEFAVPLDDRVRPYLTRLPVKGDHARVGSAANMCKPN